MSLNSEESKGSGGAGGASQAPRLVAGGYAAWKPMMDVHLQRISAEETHTEPQDVEAWKTDNASHKTWSRETKAAARAVLHGDAATSMDADGASSSTPGTAKKLVLSDEVKAARKIVSADVERSHRIFGAIYAALPDDLRAPVAHIPQGFAYGLWHWLETKFQSTEEDSVDELWSRFAELSQSVEDESFDAYRARVNQLMTLLEHAKVKPHASQYSFVLLGKLQPRYRHAVLALKASGHLKDANKVSWDTVTAFINAHEREEQRQHGDVDSSAETVAMAATAHVRERHTHAAGAASSTSWARIPDYGRLHTPRLLSRNRERIQAGPERRTHAHQAVSDAQYNAIHATNLVILQDIAL